MNDQLTLAGSRSGFGSNKSMALTWKEEIPFGYYTFSYSGSYSDSRYDLYSEDKESDLVVNNLKNKLNLSRVVYRGLDNQLSFGASFWHYSPMQKFAEKHLSTVGKKLAVFEASLHHNYYNSLFRILTEFNYAQGTKLFGASKDGFVLQAGDPHAQFRRYKLTSDYLWKISNNIHVNGNLQLQYAQQGLPGVVKLPVLDEVGGIRGAKADSITKDDGVLLRHDLVFSPIFSSIKQDSFFQKIMISPFIHADIGWAKDKGEHARFERFGALGAGVKIDFHKVDVQLTASKLVDKPTEIEGEGWVIMFGLGIKIM